MKYTFKLLLTLTLNHLNTFFINLKIHMKLYKYCNLRYKGQWDYWLVWDKDGSFCSIFIIHTMHTKHTIILGAYVLWKRLRKESNWSQCWKSAFQLCTLSSRPAAVWCWSGIHGRARHGPRSQVIKSKVRERWRSTVFDVLERTKTRAREILWLSWGDRQRSCTVKRSRATLHEN